MSETWTLIDCLHGWENTVEWNDDSQSEERNKTVALPDTERDFDGPGLAEWSTDDETPREVRVKVVRAEELDRADHNRQRAKDESERLLDSLVACRERAEQAEAERDAARKIEDVALADVKRAEAALREIAEHISTPLNIQRIARAALPDEGGGDG